MLSSTAAAKPASVQIDTMKAVALMESVRDSKPTSAIKVAAPTPTGSAAPSRIQSADESTHKSTTFHAAKSSKKFNIKVLDDGQSSSGGGDDGGSPPPDSNSQAPTQPDTARGGPDAPDLKAPTKGDPVRLSDGTLDFQTTDLESEAFSTPFGQVRSWTNNPVYVSTISNLGNGWTLGNIPTLVQPQGRWGPQIVLENGESADVFTSTFSWYLAKPLPAYGDDKYLYYLYDGENNTWVFSGGGPEPLVPANPTDPDGYSEINPNYVPPPILGEIPPQQYSSDYYKPTDPVYAPQFEDANTLTYSSGNDTYIWKDSQGNRYVFDGFSQYGADAAGRAQAYYPALGGSETTFTYNSNGYISEVDRTGAFGSASVTEKWVYTYNSSGPLQNVLLERSSDGGALSTVGSVGYNYYSGSTLGGNSDDLEDATVFDSTGAAVSETFYRYYLPGEANGYTSGLEYAFTPQAFDRLVHALPVGTTPDTATDAQIAPYATQYFQYNSEITTYLAPGATGYSLNQVTQETVSGFGTNADGDTGDGTINFQYSFSSNYDPTFDEDGQQTPDLDVWWYKTVETYGDGSSDTTYLNSAGLSILTSHLDPDGVRTDTVNDYDPPADLDGGNGLVLATYEPSAITGYSETADGGDLVQGASYNVAGTSYFYSYDRDNQLTLTQLVQNNNYVPIENLTYVTIGDDSTNPLDNTQREVVSSDTLYRGDEGNEPERTSYAYSLGGASAPLTITTTAPTPSTGENASASSSVTTDIYDQNGALEWELDPDGSISYWAHDLATGAVTTSIVDVNTATFNDGPIPAGWSGAGANLTTTDEVDDQGNATEQTDPDGNITYYTYDYPDHIYRVYPGWHQVPGTNTYTTTGPVQVTEDNWADSLTDQLTYDPGALAESVPDGSDPITNVQTLTRTSVDASGQTVESDQYFNLSGLTYSATPNLGTAGLNYYPTTYGYNVLGYQNEVTSPTSTITQNTYDSLGRLTSTAVGTSESNLTDTADYQYDNGAAGDGNLTQMTVHPGGGAPDRVTQYFYDAKDEQIGELEGAGTSSGILLYTEYDNVGEPVLSEQFAVGSATITGAELVDSSGDGIPSGLSAGELRARTIYSWNEQGQLYQEEDYSVNQTTGVAATTPSITNYYYDLDGNVIATQAPTGQWTKDTYNGAGQVVAQYETDGASGATWADAGSVSGDHVLSQDVYQYDNDGNLTTDTTSDRLATDSDSAAGALTAGGSVAARISEQAWYYDAADRLTESVNLGTNTGGFSYDASNPPARSSTALATTYGYNSAGWVNEETDPKGIESRYEYDNAGNSVETISDYTDGTPTDDSNQTTQYTYDGDGNVTSMTAVMPAGTPDEVTQYNYGVSGAVSSNDLLASVEYPDPTTGAASASQTETYGYDALGEPTTYTDRNGTSHEYSYDSLGHLTSDQVTAFGTGVDQTVAKLGYTYTDTGQLAAATSYDGSGNVLNQVQETYDGFGQLASDAQSHDGPVVSSGTSATPTVSYTYDATKGDRITSMTYPDGRTINYNYGTSLDDLTSRIASISDSSGTIQSYAYQGTSTPMTMVDGNGVELGIAHIPSGLS
jgi:YD repeat-containing protein